MSSSTDPALGERTPFDVVVMAKHPTPGAVKTRLARALGDEAAAMLYRAFILDLDGRLRVEGIVATWAYAPPDAPFGELLPGAPLVVQPGGDLGERMAAVVRQVLDRSARPVILLGADVPHVDTGVVWAAGTALAAGDEVVLGPTEDGGYYLLGLGRFLPELFRGISWGSARVFAETYAHCTARGIRPRLMPRTFDVDEAPDLTRLAALLAEGRVALPRTRSALARLRLS